jgi:hypothetical protein
MFLRGSGIKGSNASDADGKGLCVRSSTCRSTAKRVGGELPVGYFHKKKLLRVVEVES